MKNAKQRLVVGGAVVLAGAVWLPVLLERSSETPEGPTIGAEDGVAIVPASLSAFPGPGAADAGTEEPAQGSSSRREASSLDPGTASSEMPTEQQGAPGERRGTDLASLLASLRSHAELGVDSSDANPSTSARSSGALLSAQTARETLAAFAQDNQLRGVIHGSDSSLAVLGHRVVRTGDLVAGGTIEVLEIGPDWLRLGRAGEERVVDLEPFQAKDASTDHESASPSTPADAEATTPAESSPSPAPAPASAGGPA